MNPSGCPDCGVPLTKSVSGEYCSRCAGRLLLSAGARSDFSGDAEPRSVGLSIGDYELGKELGRGGMGVVYRARQARLRRDVAVKVILASQFAGEVARKRLLAEAELAAQLDHPNIVPIYEVGETTDGPFYAMKLVEGRTLAEQLAGEKGRRWESERAAALIVKISHAVHHAHQRGVLHRDLKPGNILVDARGEPHVTDFGLARMLGADGSLTLTGSMVGTPAYMAPEQASGERIVTTAADVWSLGAIFFHVLTGRPPFIGDSVADLIVQSRTQDPPALRTLDPEIPRDLETICLKCLEKDAVRRYSSALRLAEDLERWQQRKPIEARPISSTERLVKWAQRRPAIAALLALAGLLFAAGIIGITWQWRRANKHADTAESALTQTREALWQSNFDRAQALRTSHRMGQRVKSLEAIRAAAAIRPSPELREQAIAAMALTDLEDEGRWLPYPTQALDWMPDLKGERFAFSRADGVIEIRRIADGNLLMALTNRPGRLRFQFDGDYLLMHDRERYRIWNTDTGQLVFEMPVLYESSASHLRASLSPDGRWFGYPISKTAVAWRELGTEREAGRLEGFADAGRLAFSAQAEFLAVKSGQKFEVWRLSNQKSIGTFTIPAESLQWEWHRKEPLLTIGCDDKNLYVWDVLRASSVTVGGHRREGVFGNFHPEQGLLASTSFDAVLRLWDPSAGLELLQTTVARPSRFGDDGQWLVVRNGRGIGKLKVHRPEECRPFHARYGLRPAGLRFSADDRFALGTRTDESWFSVWDVASGQRLTDVTLRGTKSARFYGERQLVTSSQEGVLLWTNVHRAGGWEPMRAAIILPPERGHASFVLSADETRILLHRDQAGDLYEFPSGRLILKLRGQRLFANPAFSTDGQWIASGYWDNGGKRGSEFWIWSGTDGQLVRKIPMGNCAAHFSPDGRWLLAASEREYYQYAVEGHPTQWPLVRTFSREMTGFLHGPAAFSGDGRWLALMADSTVVRLIEADTGRELARISPLPEITNVGSLNFSRDGRWLVTGTDLGSYVWDLARVRSRLREMNLDWEVPQ